MLLSQELNEKGGGDNEGELQFSWGRKMGVQYYLSFTYNGVHYSRYNCVYIRRCDDEPEPGIGKLVKIFETATGKKRVKVVWFFRPAKVQNWLGDIRTLPNELFLASGEGKGVFSLNLLENVCGKCSVICISKDRRNPQPTEEESRKAKYVFFRAFDDKTCTISNIFPDVIAEVEVKNYFNQRKDSKLLHPAKESLSPTVTLEKKASSSTKNWATTISPLKKKCESALDTSLPKKRKIEKDSAAGPSPRPKTSQGKDSVARGVNLDRKVSKFRARADHLEKKKGVITNSQTTGVARRPEEDSVKWFKEQRMAVWTSHHSQSNTIEYEMALEWFVLQQQSNIWWKTLYKKHAKEITELKNKVKIP